MKKLRQLVLVLLMLMVLSLPPVAPPVYASGGDAVGDWLELLHDYFWE